MIKIFNIINEIISHINDSRYNLELKICSDGVFFRASFYHDYYYVDKETRIYTNSELAYLNTFIGAILDDIAEITYHVFDCHALSSNITKEFLNELERRYCNERD